MTTPIVNPCAESEQLHAYALHALSSGERSAMETHLAGCADCRNELAALRPVIDALVDWPTDVLRPATSPWPAIAGRIGIAEGIDARAPAAPRLEWEEVAPGISCKLLATDTERDRVSMLVRLAPNTAYPAHRHAGVEELHLLDGELWIEDRKLLPGDYNRAEPGTSDQRVFSKTGCTCVLITSPGDILR